MVKSDTYPHVGHLVIVQVGGGSERFTAHLALVRLLSCVDPPVGVEAGAGGEPFVTNITNMRSLARVNSDMSLEKAGSVKLLATGLTGQHCLGSPWWRRSGLRLRLWTGRRVLGGVTVLAGEETPGEVQRRLRDEGLEVPLDEGLPQQVDGGQEEVRAGGDQVRHQLRPGLHLADRLEDDLSSLGLPAQHVDLGCEEWAGGEEPHPVAVPDQPALLLPHLVLHTEPVLELELSQQGEWREEFFADIALPRLELFPLLQPLGGGQC